MISNWVDVKSGGIVSINLQKDRIKERKLYVPCQNQRKTGMLFQVTSSYLENRSPRPLGVLRVLLECINLSKGLGA